MKSAGASAARLTFALAVATSLLSMACERVQAEVLHSTIASYRTGQDPYNSNPDFGSTDMAVGTATTSLGFSGRAVRRCIQLFGCGPGSCRLIEDGGSGHAQ